MKNEQLEIKEQTAVQKVETSPFALLTMAVSQDLDIAKLEKLMQLQERWEANNSRKSFLQAMSNFQFKCPKIKKLRKVSFGTTKYSFASLSEISEAIKEGLKNNGLSYRWELKDDGTLLTCSCIVSHIEGHSEITNVSAGKDSSGGKNEIQQRGSTITYLQRYSLIAALGISTADDDTNGNKPKEKEEMTPAHPKWKACVSSLKDKSITMQQVKSNYSITTENERRMTNEAV